MKGPAVLSLAVSEDLITRLSSLCYITFNLDNMVPSTFSFVNRYSSSFMNDFSAVLMVNNEAKSNPAFPQTLQELLQRLLLWKQHMKECIASKAGEFLVHELFAYNRHSLSTLEIPGQRSHNFSQTYANLEMLRGHIPTLYKEQHNWRYVDMIDENAKTHRFYMEQVNAVDMLIGERTRYFQLFFDMIAQNSHPIQMRHMQFSLPAYIHITPTLRLVSFKPHSVTLEGVYQEFLGDRFDEKQLEYAIKVYMLTTSKKEIPAAYKDWCSQISTRDLFSSVVPDDLLTQFM